MIYFTLWITPGINNMKTTENLKTIISRQKETVSALEAELKALEGSDLAKENAALKSELDKLRAYLYKLRADAQMLTDENKSFRTALYEQIYNEKVSFVGSTEQRLDIYFRSSVLGEMNRLSSLEAEIKGRLDSMKNTLAYFNVDIHDNIYMRIGELWQLLDYKVNAARAEAARMTAAFSEEERAKFEALKNEQLTDEQIRAVTKKNNIERILGLNVFNAIGILLMVIGAIAFARFAFVLLPDVLKGIMLFALGGALLAVGEIRNRKKPNVFSLGLTAGGIGIMYTAMVASFFALHIIDTVPTAAICVAITAGAFVLANRYNSQIIAAFALIGGYLPIFALDSISYPANEVILYGAMVYFVVLNIFALLISFRKKWRVTAFIGLFLNSFGTYYICSFFTYGAAFALKTNLAVIYVLFAFLIYTAIPIVSTYRAELKFKPSDIVFLSINTVISSAMMYYVFDSLKLDRFNGLLALIFAAIYLILGKRIDIIFKGEAAGVKMLFYINGLAFIVLFIPLQFGETWLSLGWLVEGVLLASYGIIKGEKRFRIAGFVVCIMCLITFLNYDLAFNLLQGSLFEDQPRTDLFPYKYLAITLGSLVILGAYMYKKMIHGKIYKYFVMANLWVFVMYLIFVQLKDALDKAYGTGTVFQTAYLLYAAAIAITFFFAYGIVRIKLLYDPGTKIFSAVIYVIGIVMFFSVNADLTPVTREYMSFGTPSTGALLAATAILAALGFLSILAMRELMKMLVTGRKIGVEWYPLIVSGYIVIILTQILLTQYGIVFSNAAITIIYGLTALAWIVFGFIHRFSLVRKFGLGLAMFSVIKLFLVDLSALTEGYRIISYFALGGTLIAISFGYQYFSKRLELADPPGVKEEIPDTSSSVEESASNFRS